MELTGELKEKVGHYRQAVRNVSQLHQQMKRAASAAQANDLLQQILYGSYKGYSYKEIAIKRNFL